MKFLINMSACGQAFAFCGIDPKAGDRYSKADNKIYSLHVFNTDALEFCNAIDECIKQANLNRHDRIANELCYDDTYEVQVGECRIKRIGARLMIASGWHDSLLVDSINQLKPLTKALRKKYNALMSNN